MSDTSQNPPAPTEGGAILGDADAACRGVRGRMGAGDGPARAAELPSRRAARAAPPGPHRTDQGRSRISLAASQGATPTRRLSHRVPRIADRRRAQRSGLRRVPHPQAGRRRRRSAAVSGSLRRAGNRGGPPPRRRGVADLHPAVQPAERRSTRRWRPARRLRSPGAARQGGLRQRLSRPAAVDAAARGAEGLGRSRRRTADAGPARSPAHRPRLRSADLARTRPAAAVHAVHPGRHAAAGGRARPRRPVPQRSGKTAARGRRSRAGANAASRRRPSRAPRTRWRP